MLNQLPFLVYDRNIVIDGILRYDLLNNKTLILVPPRSNSRIGPHRLFVELSHTLVRKGINTCTIEQRYNPNNESGRLSRYYSQYAKILKKVIGTICSISGKKNEIVLLLLCESCYVFQYSDLRKIGKVILLSPKLPHLNIFDKKNNLTSGVPVLCVFGDKDPDMFDNLTFSPVVDVKTVKNSNSLFYGWEQKKELFEVLEDWIRKNL